MSDIFEIKRKKIELRIGDSVFEIKDPKFADKVMIQKEFKALEKEKAAAGEDDSEYLLKAFALNKKSIQLFIPKLTDEILENEVPESSYILLMQKITEISNENFGASVEKVEKK